MRQRDLLAAVARIDPIRLRGTFERHTWPKVTNRDIWRGLPPDPRRLRLVDEA